jgi:hypothetical protein
MMKRMIFLGLCVLITASAALSQKKAKTSTIIGDVVDVKNYVMFGVKADNPDRKSIAEASINAGNPIGLLETKTKKLYLIMVGNENPGVQPKDFLGVHVYVKGIVYQKGKIQLIVMSDIGKSIR